jgi:hypothetical protein
MHNLQELSISQKFHNHQKFQNHQSCFALFTPRTTSSTQKKNSNSHSSSKTIQIATKKQKINPFFTLRTTTEI